MTYISCEAELNASFDEFILINNAYELFVSHDFDNNILKDVIGKTIYNYNIPETLSRAAVTDTSREKVGSIALDSSKIYESLALNTQRHIRLLLRSPKEIHAGEAIEKDYASDFVPNILLHEISILQGVHIPFFYQHINNENLKTDLMREHKKLAYGISKSPLSPDILTKFYKRYDDMSSSPAGDIKQTIKANFNGLVKLGDNTLEIAKLRLVETTSCLKHKELDLADEFASSGVNYLKVAKLYLSGGELDNGPFLGANYFLNRMTP